MPPATGRRGQEPRPNAARSLLLGTGVVVVLYLALNLVFACAVPLTDVGFDNAEQVPQLRLRICSVRESAAPSPCCWD
jgi:hypothetical protein